MPPAAPSINTQSPALQPTALQQRVVGGVVRAEEDGRLLEAHPAGTGIAILGRALPSSAKAPSRWRLITPVAEFKPRHPGADRDDFACALVAGKNGGSGRNWYLPASIKTSTY